jgi:copper(I)-binding protein
MRTPRRFILPAAIAVVLTAAAFFSFARSGEIPAGELAVISAWARATPLGADTGAAYVTIENRGAADDRLTGASTPAAASVSVHETAEENGVATMRQLADASVPAGRRLDMRPGGAHLMLMGLSAPLVEGDSVRMALTFEHAGKLTVQLKVAAIGAEEPPAGHDHSM